MRPLTFQNDTITNISIDYTIKEQSEGLKIQVGANSGQTLDISIEDMSLTSQGYPSGFPRVIPVSDAQTSIAYIDEAISYVSSGRSSLGAMQNALEHIINNVTNSSLNLTAAESRIRDTDMEKEMMDMVKNNILSKASQSMLTQSNQQPEGILQLLK